MITPNFPVVLDACVLVPPKLCDLLLRLAEAPRFYLPLWSEETLREVERTQIKVGWPESLTKSWQREVRKHFPESLVDGVDLLEPVCGNDPKDRHVLAAAIKGKSELIVTFNLRHFPKTALEPFGVTAIHPANYLITLYGMDPAVFTRKMLAVAYNAGQMPVDRLIVQLTKTVPAFTRHVADAWGLDLPKELRRLVPSPDQAIPGAVGLSR